MVVTGAGTHKRRPLTQVISTWSPERMQAEVGSSSIMLSMLALVAAATAMAAVGQMQGVQAEVGGCTPKPLMWISAKGICKHGSRVPALPGSWSCAHQTRLKKHLLLPMVQGGDAVRAGVLVPKGGMQAPGVLAQLGLGVVEPGAEALAMQAKPMRG